MSVGGVGLFVQVRVEGVSERGVGGCLYRYCQCQVMCVLPHWTERKPF